MRCSPWLAGLLTLLVILAAVGCFAALGAPGLGDKLLATGPVQAADLQRDAGDVPAIDVEEQHADEKSNPGEDERRDDFIIHPADAVPFVGGITQVGRQ